jgi:hypothetical protein
VKATPITTATEAPAVHAPAGRHPSPAKPVCSTVPYFDADGAKHFRQECK